MILRDCARSVQYLRHRDDLGLAALPTVTMGSSAGGDCAVWVGVVGELAQPGHADPVLRASSRVQGMVHSTSQATLDFSRWEALLGIPQPELSALLGELPAGLSQQTEAATWAPGPLNTVVDAATWWGPDDPPLWTETDQPYPETVTDSSTLLHTPVGQEALYADCVAAGGDCSLRTPRRSEGRTGSLSGFLLGLLGAP